MSDTCSKSAEDRLHDRVESWFKKLRAMFQAIQQACPKAAGVLLGMDLWEATQATMKTKTGLVIDWAELGRANAAGIQNREEAILWRLLDSHSLMRMASSYFNLKSMFNTLSDDNRQVVWLHIDGLCRSAERVQQQSNSAKTVP